MPSLEYGPVTPFLASLEPDERHLYTFTINPYVFKEGCVFPPRIAAWYPEGTRFVWHLTDKRILVETCEMSKAAGLVMKGLLALGNMDIGSKIGNMAAKQDWQEGQDRMLSMQEQWCAIHYPEIAMVEKKKIGLIRAAKVTFKTPDTQPLVFSAQVATAGAFNPWNYSNEFVGVMSEILKS